MLLERFHSYGGTMGSTMKYTIQEDIGHITFWIMLFSW